VPNGTAGSYSYGPVGLKYCSGSIALARTETGDNLMSLQSIEVGLQSATGGELERQAVSRSGPVTVTILMPGETPETSRVVGQLRASAVGSWAVEVSTDLVEWKELRRVEADTPGLFEVPAEPVSDSAVRFYRLRQVSGR
jgi:DTW domain-containing protein YfiP